MQKVIGESEVETRRSAREVVTRVVGTTAALVGLGLVIDTTMDATELLFDPTPTETEHVIDAAGDHSMLPGVFTIVGGSVVALTGAYYALRD